jgi:manganese-dependent inorganic pyrophosphatase
VAGCYQQAGIPIPAPFAGILMCGLIADTLNLSSPTTTDVDRRTLEELSKITGIVPGDLASEIFSVGSPLLTLTPEQVITADCKEYTERGSRFSVSQIEELSFSHLGEQQAALIDALEAYRAANNYLFSTLLVTDVNTQNSILLVRGAAAFTKLIDFPDDGPWAWKLHGIVSRKKQLLPYLTGLIARAV